jgi:hypothetical protein
MTTLRDSRPNSLERKSHRWKPNEDETRPVTPLPRSLNQRQKLRGAEDGLDCGTLPFGNSPPNCLFRPFDTDQVRTGDT